MVVRESSDICRWPPREISPLTSGSRGLRRFSLAMSRRPETAVSQIGEDCRMFGEEAERGGSSISRPCRARRLQLATLGCAGVELREYYHRPGYCTRTLCCDRLPCVAGTTAGIEQSNQMAVPCAATSCTLRAPRPEAAQFPPGLQSREPTRIPLGAVWKRLTSPWPVS